MMEVFYKKLIVLQAQHLSRVPGRKRKKIKIHQDGM